MASANGSSNRNLAHEDVGAGVDDQLDTCLVGGGAQGSDVVGVLLHVPQPALAVHGVLDVDANHASV